MPLTIITSLVGPGAQFLEDDGIAGNATGQIRWAGTTTSPFVYPADSLAIQSAAGQSFVINLLDSLTTATFTIGSLTNTAITPDALTLRNIESTAAMTMVATKKISEGGSDAAAEVTAASLVLSAGTGIGQSNAIETQVSTLEAETTTGGINIVNLGNVNVGGLTADVSGLSVGTSGSINLTAFGSIGLTDTDGLASIQSGSSSGNVVLKAQGAGASIFSSVNHDAITAAGGNITMSTGGNVTFGTGGNDFDNDVRAKGSIEITAGGYFYIDGFTDIASDDFAANTGKGIKINAAAGIYILDNLGSDASLSAGGTAGADVVLKAGANSTFSLQGVGTTAIFSNSGDVTASADYMSIATDSGITALNGTVTLRPTTSGRRIDIGTASDSAVALGLSDAELDRIFSPQLFIGGANTGKVTFSSSITPLNVTDLTVQAGSDIMVNAGVAVLTTGKLVLRAADDILLLAGSFVQGSNGVLGFVDNSDEDSVGGRASVDAAFAGTVHFIGNKDRDTLFGGSVGDILDGRGDGDTMTGRNGDDVYYVDTASDKVIEAASEGEDTVRSSVSRTLGANLERLELQGNGNLDGKGNALANTFVGNSGNNELEGMAGADELNGGRGNDKLTGGGAADSFVFNSKLDANTNVDKITDFSIPNDTIELESSIFKHLGGTGTLSAAVFHKGASAADGTDHIIYNAANGWISYDPDGKNGDAAIHFATVDAGLNLTRNDFVVI